MDARFSMLLILCAVAGAYAGFSDASVEEVQKYLKDWDLHEFLGDGFRSLRYDGRYLEDLELSDFEQSRFPSATRAHWRILLKEIKNAQQQHKSRRLEEKLDTTGYKGVFVRSDKSLLSLGAKADVQLVRTGPRKLAVKGDVTAGSLAVKKLTVDGKPVGGGDLESMLKDVQKQLKNLTATFRNSSCAPGKEKPKAPVKDCEDIKEQNPKAQSGVYEINYDGKKIKVMCDMVTAGGGWTLILRDSWKEKKVFTAGTLPAENSVGTPGGSGDYVGPHFMGTVSGTNPLKTNAQYLYKVDSCTTKDCAMISDQEYSFHASNEGQVDSGFHSSPIMTLSGKTVHADNTNNNRLNYFYLNKNGDCGLSTDRDNGGNCWNNMFAKNRWENLPGGKTQCFSHKGCTSSGDANSLWLRRRKVISSDVSSCHAIKKMEPSSTDGFYHINYLGRPLLVKCDMTTDGGGWTLILRDSWKDKSVIWAGKTSMRGDNSHGTSSGYLDYVGPHYMGSAKGSNPLTTSVDYMYTGSGCDSADCKFISRQQYSFHNNNEGQVDKGFHSSPLKTLSGKMVKADKNNNHRLNYFYLYPDTGGCGLSTDRDNGGNCWNNMFANHRWENMPGGSSSCHYHGNPSCMSVFGDANMLWVRPR